VADEIEARTGWMSGELPLAVTTARSVPELVFALDPPEAVPLIEASR
jgi:hypothetical protein